MPFAPLVNPNCWQFAFARWGTEFAPIGAQTSQPGAEVAAATAAPGFGEKKYLALKERNRLGVGPANQPLIDV